ncbi:hypothetical protein FE257_011604 [Aspergillus nanangensis]|uniref:Bacteriophage T5 Orf172 DNA-binding domain-containing protein n=1 Tax=Aspergillus nanangensis TaxID=2582783 RepID=A0AAD4CV85_ASPNN|nr:hypothetical protein FE257_011604 [Aspergillus nanangensis]
MVSSRQSLPVDSDVEMLVDGVSLPETGDVMYLEGLATSAPGGNGEKKRRGKPKGSPNQKKGSPHVDEKRPTTPIPSDEDDDEDEEELPEDVGMSEQEDHQTPAPSTPQRSPSAAPVHSLRTPQTEDRTTPTVITPKGLESIDQIIAKMCGTMRTIPVKYESGYVYVFCEPTEETTFYKIGHAVCPETRLKDLQKNCFAGWTMYDRPYNPRNPIGECVRVENLAHYQLRNYACTFECRCKTKHREYFSGKKQAGLNMLQFWIDWLQREQPFGEDRHLTPFWADRVDALDMKMRSRLRHLFKCGQKGCAGRIDTHRGACQDCLETGWKLWTEPTSFERFEYGCRTQMMGWPRIQDLLLWLWKCGSFCISESTLFWTLDKMAYLPSLWTHFIKPAKDMVGWRFILCCVLFCLPGPFHGQFSVEPDKLIPGAIFVMVVFFIHSKPQETSVKSAPMSPEAKKRLQASSPLMAKGSPKTPDITPSTQEMTQVTPEGDRYLRVSPPEGTPSRPPRSKRDPAH